MKRAVMYGAGNIGRGFIGQLFSKSGYEVHFLDVNEEVVNLLNRDGRYPVNVVCGSSNEEQFVENVRGVLTKDNAVAAKEIFEADVMASAVGVNVLKFIAKPIAMGIEMRMRAGKAPINFIICENLIDANLYLKKLILDNLPEELHKDFDKSVGLVEASIGRMVPVMDEKMQAGNKLRVYVEPYNVLPVDKDAFVGEIPKIENMVPFSPFQLFIQRKLFMHNMSHALCAYLGYLSGDKYVYEAASKPEIKLLALHALTESARALSKENKVEMDSLLEHAENLLYRFTNEALKDTVARVGRDTQRKLSPNDRLAGAYRLCAKHGVPSTYICVGIAAALLFRPEGDASSVEIADYAKLVSPRDALKKYAGFTGTEPEMPFIERIYRELSSGASAKELIPVCYEEGNKGVKI